METRAKDYYGLNAVDMAALVNELQIIGNKRAELILSENKIFTAMVRGTHTVGESSMKRN